MLFRYTAEHPQRVLQSLRQGRKALTAEHDMGVLEARERQSKVIEPVIERMAGNRDLEPSVKSDSPSRPGSYSCQKITSRSGPLSARHALMRRSSVRRTLGLRPG